MPPIIPAPTDIPEEEAENASAMPTTIENLILPHSDSDSESENIDHDGYELLSQDPEVFFTAEDDDEDYNPISDIEESITAEVNNLNAGSIYLPDSEYQNTECFSEVRTMTDAHIETIKSVMKGITLPSSNLPQWASLVPEEEWKAALFSQMHERKSKSDCNIREVHSKPCINKNKFDMSSEALR